MDEKVRELAAMLRERNDIDARIAQLIGRPALVGHLGEWIASAVFDIELEKSASAKALDGRFRAGPLAGRTVNIKWYGKREGMLDTSDDEALDYYLVLTGPKAASMTSVGGVRPFAISNVYLFDARALRRDRHERGTASGTASSVRRQLWTAAEIYPACASDSPITLSAEQQSALEQFRP